MKQEDLDAMVKLLKEVEENLPALYKLKRATDQFYGLIVKAAEGKQLTLGEDVCCRTCEYWEHFGTIWDDRGERHISREEAGLGCCHEPGM
jgi:hypothetical protein